jgi:hypothetical protein
MEKQKIPGRNEWYELTISQLYETKSQLTTLYYNMRGAGASYASQYLGFINEVDALIQRREFEALQAEAAEQANGQ